MMIAILLVHFVSENHKEKFFFHFSHCQFQPEPLPSQLPTNLFQDIEPRSQFSSRYLFSSHFNACVDGLYNPSKRLIFSLFLSLTIPNEWAQVESDQHSFRTTPTPKIINSLLPVKLSYKGNYIHHKVYNHHLHVAHSKTHIFVLILSLQPRHLFSGYIRDDTDNLKHN